MNWARCVVGYLSHAKALPGLGRYLEKNNIPLSHYSRRMEEKGLTLICVGAIVANHVLNYFFPYRFHLWCLG